MKNYIERYIYAVTKRLPEAQREDVKKDLEANIYDMLSENPDDTEIDQVLHDLGNPRIIAQNYQGEPKYMIDPILYSDYKTTLKIVLIIVGSLSVFFNAMDALLNIGDVTFWTAFGLIFGKIIDGLFSSVMTWFTLITLLFWGLSQKKTKNEILNKWKLKDLPETAKPEKVTINRIRALVEFTFSTIFSILFIVILIAYIDKIGAYDQGILVAQVFNQDVISPFIPVFIGSYLLSVVVYAMKIKNQRYTLNMVIVYSVSQLAGMIALFVMLNDNSLVLPEFIDYFSLNSRYSVVEITEGIYHGVRVFTTIAIIFIVLDIGTYWRKLYKTSRKEVV